MSAPPLAKKNSPGLVGCGSRLVPSVLDRRALGHLFKVLNCLNGAHVAPLRQVTFAGARNIKPDGVSENPERIVIGHRVRIGSRCHLWAGPRDGRIRIGDDALFGPEVMVTAATHRHDLDNPVTDQPMAEGDSVIGDHVSLATRANVLPGTTLGEGAIVAAGAVAKVGLPAMSILAGAPARTVSQRVISSDRV